LVLDESANFHGLHAPRRDSEFGVVNIRCDAEMRSCALRFVLVFATAYVRGQIGANAAIAASRFTS
jgi:hypothetical protein